MKRGVLVVLLLVSLGVNIGFLLHWAWPRIHGGAKDGLAQGWHNGPMRRHLSLSSGQARQMESERRQVLAQARPVQDELRLKRRQLFVLLKKSPVSQAELDVALSDISRLQTSIEKIFILHSLKVKGYFSPAQMHKFEDYMEQGLCPNMTPGAACPPGSISGRPGCGNANETKP